MKPSIQSRVLNGLLFILSVLIFFPISADAAERTIRRQQYMQLRRAQLERMRENERSKQSQGDIDIHKDLVYGSEHQVRQSLDLYVPKDAKAPLPLVVWIHGGAWMAGDKNWNPATPLLNEGFAVASINYRLSQIATFPAQIHDCKAAIRYLRANADTYHIDPNSIGVWGASAGGHLVALLGVTNGNKELEGAVGDYLKTSSDVQAVCDWFGPSDMLTMSIGKRQFEQGKDPELLLLGGPLSEKRELAELASPVTHVTKDAPPFLIMHGDQDNLVPIQQSRLLNDKLKAAGADSTLIVMEGKGHGFGNDPSVLEPVIKFFNRTLKPQKAENDKPAG